MADPTFMADPTRLVVSAIIGIVLLLALIIKFKLHPVLSMMVSAIFIGIGAGMPLDLVASTVTKGVGMTLQNIALLIGLGSMFGQILEESGGAKKIAQTFIDKFGQGHSSWALGITGLVIGTTVFFEAGVVVLIPLAFSVASQTKKSTLYYGIALLTGLAAGYAFVPPSAGSVLVAGTLGVDLGTLILVGVPTAFIAMAVAGVAWGRNVGGRFFVEVPEHVAAAEEEGDQKEAPSFGMVLAIVLTPLCLILLGTLSSYIPIPKQVADVLSFIGKPFVALTLATLVAMYLLGTRRGYTGAELKALLDRSLKPVGMILLVRASVGSSIVAMTMASGIMAAMPAVAASSVLMRAAICIAICGGATALSHVNDAGFWMCSSFLEIDEKTTLSSWTVMETLIGIVGLVCALVISMFA
jgi:H+/gluconate symporter-like permease